MRTKHLPIAEPCHEDWNAMDPVARGRFCHSCTKQVFDLASMTRAEARAVLDEHAGHNICVRYRYGDDGALRFRPERRIGLPAAAAIATALAACTPVDNPRVEAPKIVVEDGVETRAPTVIPHVDAPQTLRLTQGGVRVPDPPHQLVKGDVAAPPRGQLDELDEPCDAKPQPTGKIVKGRIKRPR